MGEGAGEGRDDDELDIVGRGWLADDAVGVLVRAAVTDCGCEVVGCGCGGTTTVVERLVDDEDEEEADESDDDVEVLRVATVAVAEAAAAA